MTLGGTFLIRMATNSMRLTFTPEKTAVIQRLIGTKYRNMNSAIIATTNITNNEMACIILLVYRFDKNYIIIFDFYYFYFCSGFYHFTISTHFKGSFSKLRLADRP